MALKPKSEGGGRGRGRGRGGRGGRGGGCREVKQEEGYCYNDEETWAEYYKWCGNGSWEDWHEWEEAEGPPKKKKKKNAPKEVKESKETKKSETTRAKPEKRKVEETFVPAYGKKQIIADVVKFVQKFDYRTLDLESMKACVKVELPTMQNISLNCYWTRAACGVRRKDGKKFVEVPNAYFRFTTCHANHCTKLAVAVGLALQLASQSSSRQLSFL